MKSCPDWLKPFPNADDASDLAWRSEVLLATDRVKGDSLWT